jgi:hypothetical protein
LVRGILVVASGKRGALDEDGLCGIALVDVHVTVAVSPAIVACAVIVVGSQVYTVPVHAWVFLGNISTIIQVDAARLQLKFSHIGCSVSAGRGNVREHGSRQSAFDAIFHSVVIAKAITSPAGIADAVVASRVVLACSLVVADMDTHFAFIPVGATRGTSPSHNALASEAQTAAIRACTTMSTGRNILTVVNILTLHFNLPFFFSHIDHLPSEMADTLVAASCVNTVGIFVTCV